MATKDDEAKTPTQVWLVFSGMPYECHDLVSVCGSFDLAHQELGRRIVKSGGAPWQRTTVVDDTREVARWVVLDQRGETACYLTVEVWDVQHGQDT